jgi:hypothetical protein
MPTSWDPPLSGLFNLHLYQGPTRQMILLIQSIEDKMNKDLRSELETQEHILETTMTDMETFKGAKSDTSRGGEIFQDGVFTLWHDRATQGRT